MITNLFCLRTRINYSNDVNSDNLTLRDGILHEPRFRWEESKIENVIKCLLEYKTCMAFKNCDWNADKVKLYENVRKSLAKIYEDEPEQFGPVSLHKSPCR